MKLDVFIIPGIQTDMLCYFLFKDNISLAVSCAMYRKVQWKLKKNFVIQNKSVNVETRLQEWSTTHANMKEKKTWKKNSYVW